MVSISKMLTNSW